MRARSTSRRQSRLAGHEHRDSVVRFGPVAWWDAAQGITLNGSTVSAWASMAPATVARAQATGANQPTWQSNGTPWGGPWVDFSAGSRFFSDVTFTARAAVAASAQITISGGSGTVGATIAGTTVTVTWGTSDAATATALAAALDADATLGPLFDTSVTSNVVTVYRVASGAGAANNSTTIVASGTGVTVTKFAGGVDSGITTFHLIRRDAAIAAYQNVYEKTGNAPPQFWYQPDGDIEISTVGTGSIKPCEAVWMLVVARQRQQQVPTSRLRINGAAQTVASTENTSMTIGGSLTLSQFARAGGSAFKGGVAEEVYFPFVMQEHQVREVETYFRRKYRLW